MIHFEIPKNQSSIIKVIGVGGGGGNAVNYMHSLDIEAVDFIVCNTDSQALTRSEVPNKIQLGPNLTSGLGAGANPEIGKQASEESLEEITKLLKVNTRMAFITAGMGGGTGTGGAPVVAKICHDLGILTVGIVTTPFSYEGPKRMKQAQEGIDRMREHVDTILIINNDKLRQQFGNLPFTKAFEKADDILATAAKCITDVINTTGQINVDFADVSTVMKNGGRAILGNSKAEGENRAHIAVEEALNSPLLNDSEISGAKWILLNITSAPGEFEHTMDEAEAIQAFVQQQAGDDCDVILGMGHDANLGASIAVTIIATGFSHKAILLANADKKQKDERVIISLDSATPSLNQDKDISKQTWSNPFRNTNATEEKIAAKDEVENLPLELSEKEKVAAPFTLNFAQQEEEQKKEEHIEESILERINRQAIADTSAAPLEMKIGERQLTEIEKEERQRFEEQKKNMEERAERLRQMSFNINAGDSKDDIENIPAYKRQNGGLSNDQGSKGETFSGYTVGFNKENESQASIQTINTFLDNNKPD